jgi:hypothetical protein
MPLSKKLVAALVAAVAVVAIVVGVMALKGQLRRGAVHEQMCSACASNPRLLPLMDPLHNIREIVKQSILLEEHLTFPDKRCRDCILKHFLWIEGLSEEAVMLDEGAQRPRRPGQYRAQLDGHAQRVRSLQKRVMERQIPPEQAAAQLRAMRKAFMPLIGGADASLTAASIHDSQHEG